MTREQAIDRVRKLRALTEARGATPAEAAAASEAAARLIARFELTDSELHVPRPVRPLLPPRPEPFPFGMPRDPLWIIFTTSGTAANTGGSSNNQVTF